MEKRITKFMIDPDQLRITTKYDIHKWYNEKSSVFLLWLDLASFFDKRITRFSMFKKDPHEMTSK